MSTRVKEPLVVASKSSSESIISRPLTENWRFRERGEDAWSPASVPGNNYLDLMAAELIPDPFFRDNESKVQWVAERDWEYCTTFHATVEELSKDRIDLVFKGVDTYAEIYLNDTHIQTCANMFCAYRCDVSELLVAGENRLRVCLDSPLKRARPMAARAGITYPAENDHSNEKLSVFTRKAPYQYGWDWGARLVTSGLWRPVLLEAYDTVRISNVNYHIEALSDESAEVRFAVEVDSALAQDVSIDVLSSEAGFDARPVSFLVGEGRRVFSVPARIAKPKLWWPNGHGDPFLYDVVVVLRVGGEVRSQARLRVGLRTVNILTDEDEIGTQFTVEVNGKKLFMKGANYIPSDSFPERVTPERYRELFASISDANMNMVRVWGGGIYENDLFYDLADEFGILVWQDFMFACTYYPATADMLANIEEEVRQNVRRLRSHPCIALWCGNNEVEMAISSWDWPAKFNYDEATTASLIEDYKELFERRLPRWLSEEDPSRFYLPSSPSGCWEDEDDDRRGDSHYWGVWHGEEPFSEYERRIPRFMSEFGFQSLPDIRSVEMFTEPGDRDVTSEVMRVHQKHGRGYGIIKRYMDAEYAPPGDFAAFLYLSQVQQAAGLKKAFAAQRLARPHCMGTLFWQMNDSWPVASWSAIDYYGRKKALYYEARRCFAPVAVFARCSEDGVAVGAVNDTDDIVSGELSLSLMRLDGEVLWTRRSPLTLRPQQAESAAIVPLSELPHADGRSEQIFVATYTLESGEACRDIFQFVASKDLSPTNPVFALKAVRGRASWNIEIRANCYATGVQLSAPPEFGVLNLDDNFISLLPGERRSLTPVSDSDLGPNDLLAFSVRSVQSPQGARVEIADATARISDV